jgi:hypothetical protein
VLEGKLNKLGITTFAQVANFSDEDIAKVDDALDFKGRIEREDWISQAVALMAETTADEAVQAAREEEGLPAEDTSADAGEDTPKA